MTNPLRLLALTTLSLFTFSTSGQLVPGFRGQWNGWGHTPMTLTGDAWRVTVQADSNGNDFKIANSDWSGEWTKSGSIPLAEAFEVQRFESVNMTAPATAGRYYTFTAYDVPLNNTNLMMVQETANAPVFITSVSAGTGTTTVSVAITTSDAPDAGEKVYLRYSVNNWATSMFIQATGSETNWTATIEHAPSQTGQTNRHYALTTTVATPTHSNAALETIRFNDNGGAYYSYIIDAGEDEGGGEEPPPSPPATNGMVYINEVVSSNLTGPVDEDGHTNDWVEIYNADTNAILLTGWGLSDDEAAPFKWSFGDNVVIQPGEFLLVWASDKNRNAITNNNQLHTSYGISSGGEEVLLTRPDGTRVDYFDPIQIPADQSMGRKPDGTGPLYFFEEPTPRAANTTTGILPPAAAPEFSLPAGMYTSNITVSITSTINVAVIRYTLDGSEPTTNSPIYTTPLNLGSKAGTTNNLSRIPTNYSDPGAPYYEGWQEPWGEVFKFHTVRARVFAEGASPSMSATRSYLIDAAGANRYSMPVVSLVTDAKNFFDPEIGIYVPGYYNNMMQSGSAWERPGTIEFFESNGTLAFSGNIGLRLHGNTTRTRPRKAIRVYARDPGSFDYPIFPDKPLARYETFILRNGGNDWGQSLFRDLLGQSLMTGVEIDRQFGRPVIVFLNGEYWGIHDLRERFDEGYTRNNHGLSTTEYTQLEIDRDVGNPAAVPVFDEGNPALATNYTDLLYWLDSNDLTSSSNYAVVTNRIDVDSFINFYQINIFGANTDWPGNNMRLWRSVATNLAEGASPKLDGRWHYMLYDMDFSFGLNFLYVPGNENSDASGQAFGVFAQHDTLSFASSDTVTSGSANDYYGTLMFRRLLANNDFKRSFITRFSDQLNTAFSRGHVTNQLASWVAKLSPEMSEHVNRWRQPYDWNSEVARVRSFAEQRTAAVWSHVQNKFGLAAPRQLTIDSIVTQGVIRVNSIALNTNTPGFSGYPWSGMYFTNYPVALTAEPRTGFRFVEWVSTSSSNTVIAQDDASNYTGWSSGNNQGTGFGAWTLNGPANSGNGGFFLAAGGWGIYANSGELAEAIRPFSATLATGQTFAVRLLHGTVDNTRSVGVALQNSSGQTLWEFSRIGGQSNYRINGVDVGIPATTDALEIEVTLAGPTSYVARISTGGSSSERSGNLQAQSNQTISRFRAVNDSAGDGSGADMIINNLQVFVRSSSETQTLSTNATVNVTLAGNPTLQAVFEPSGEAGPELVHYWNFNITNTLASLVTPTTSLVSGASITVAPGAANMLGYGGTGQGFAATNARLGDAALGHLRVDNPIGSTMDIALPTTGHRDAVVMFETRRSDSGSREQAVSYTLDGIIYTPLETLIITNAPTLYTFDFAEIPDVDNNPFFGLRVVFAQGAGGGTAGNNRFDNLTLDASPLPEAVIPALTPSGNANWNTDGNWTGNTFPNTAGSSAIINDAAGANRAVTMTTPVTIGSLMVDNAASTFRNRINGTNLTFATTSGVASLTIEGTTNGFVEFEVTGGITLATNLNITVNNIVGSAEFGALRLRETWSGTGGLRKFGPGMASLTGSNKNYEGETYIKQGVLAVSQPSTMTNGNGVTVLPGGQLRLTSATDINGPRVYAFGGTISLNSTGRSGVTEGANLGVLGALRYEPGATNSKAIVTTPVVLDGNSDIHIATASNELELSGPLSGSGKISKSGGGTLIINSAGSSYSSPIIVSNGGLRVNATLGSPVTLASGTALSGSGAVGAISGTGKVAPVGILSAESASGLNYAFVFTSTGMPVFANAAAGANDVLRLRSTNAPFAAPFTAGTQIDVYLNVASVTAGDVFGGGFFTDLPADFMAALSNASSAVYIADPAGTITNAGQTYRAYDLPNSLSFETVEAVADFAGGTVTGRITQIRIAAATASFDNWKAGSFTAEEMAHPEISGPYADPTGSGVANLYRYATGLTRNEEPRRGLPQAGRPGEQAKFIYRRLSADNPGIDYIIELNENLLLSNGWRAATMGTDLVEDRVIDNEDGMTENVEVSVPDQTIGDGIHMRLRIQPE